MRYSDESYNLRVELDTKQFELSPEDARRLQASLSPLGKLVEDLPVSDLYVTIFHHPHGSPEYQVKTALVLPAKTLFSSDTDASFHPAFGRCVTNLVQQVTAYKRTQDSADQLDKHRKGEGWKLHTELTEADLKELSDTINALGEPVSKVAAVVAQQ